MRHSLSPDGAHMQRSLSHANALWQSLCGQTDAPIYQTFRTLGLPFYILDSPSTSITSVRGAKNTLRLKAHTVSPDQDVPRLPSLTHQ